MNVPVEFARLMQCFWQGSDREATDETDWIARAIRMLAPQQRAVVKTFLAGLLDENASTEMLQSAWQSGYTGYSIPDDHIRDFYRAILALL